MGESDEQRFVTVCDKCLEASCWQGVFMCDDAQTAGTTERTVAELRRLGREHPSYWGAEGDGKDGRPDRTADWVGGGAGQVGEGQAGAQGAGAEETEGAQVGPGSLAAVQTGPHAATAGSPGHGGSRHRLARTSG